MTVTVTSDDVTIIMSPHSCDERDRMNSRKPSRPQPQASRLRNAANATATASTTTKRDSLAAELERGMSLL